MRAREAHERVHQTSVLSGHREQYLLERVGVIVDQGQDATKAIDEMIEEASVNLGFDAVDKQR